MLGIAALAAVQAAPSAFGVGSLPPIPLSVAEAFAAGVLLCGGCLLAVIAPRWVRLRNAQSAAQQRSARRPARATVKNWRLAATGGSRNRRQQAADPSPAATTRALPLVRADDTGKRPRGRHAAPSNRSGARTRHPRRHPSRDGTRD